MALSKNDLDFTVHGSPLLRNITFDLEPGEVLGIVGPNGAGKTTLCRILLGIWPCHRGNIFLDGIDIASWNQEELGGHLGYLPQEIELFPGTVKENIARMMHGVELKQVISAAKLAGAHEVILRFQDGYETKIISGGWTLSGGQRQRIALARALFNDPNLIFLDEPSSNLDQAGELALISSMQKIKTMKKSIVLVAHDPRLLSLTDKILILRQGTQAGYGPSHEILQLLNTQ